MEKRLARLERQCSWYRTLFVFAGVVVTLSLADRGQVKLRVTLEKEDVPGGWSATLGDRIIAALKGIVDLEKRGVQVEIGYK
ncbi:MAG: hypothetical protein O7A69_03265 [SAR324 cluster bacterium]|nr:hypothetical protein [SAR324 cluster bacterium]